MTPDRSQQNFRGWIKHITIMGWFRSKSMKYVQITCHQSLVEKVVQELGNKNVFQFLDSNGTMTAVQRSAKHSLFAHALTQIRRCDDMERIIRYLNSEMRRVIDTENENNFFGKFGIMGMNRQHRRI